MIITKEDVGREVVLYNGDRLTITHFLEDNTLYHCVILSNNEPYSIEGIFCRHKSYGSELDIRCFYDDLVKVSDKGIINSSTKESNLVTGEQLLKDYSSSLLGQTNIEFSIDANCTDMILEISGYRIVVEKILVK